MAKKQKSQAPDTARREALLQRIERITELPLLVLAFAMIPLLIGPLFWKLSPEEEAVFITLDTFVWAIFFIDLLIKVLVSTHRVNYLKRHWLEVLVVAVPFLSVLLLKLKYIW